MTVNEFAKAIHENAVTAGKSSKAAEAARGGKA